MLILKKNNEILNNRNAKKRLFFKSVAENNIKREKLLIDNKIFYIIYLSEKQLESKELETLLNAYKGRVLLGDDFNNFSFREYLFDSSVYFSKALLSTFIKLIKNEVVSKRNVFIEGECFFPCKELFELVRISKKVVFKFENYYGFEGFIEECYYSFGAVIRAEETAGPCWDYDYYLKLFPDKKCGECDAYINGYKKRIYPDMSYFKENDSVKLLKETGVDAKISSAVINT